MKKHHQRKLQLATATTCASGMVAPVERRETPQAECAKVRMQSANPITHCEPLSMHAHYGLPL